MLPFLFKDTCRIVTKSMGRTLVNFASDHISLSDHFFIHCPLMFCVSSLYECTKSAVFWVLSTTTRLCTRLLQYAVIHILYDTFQCSFHYYVNRLTPLTSLTSSTSQSRIFLRKVIEKQRTGTGAIKRQIQLLKPKQEINKYYK